MIGGARSRAVRPSGRGRGWCGRASSLSGGLPSVKSPENPVTQVTGGMRRRSTTSDEAGEVRRVLGLQDRGDEAVARRGLVLLPGSQTAASPTVIGRRTPSEPATSPAPDVTTKTCQPTAGCRPIRPPCASSTTTTWRCGSPSGAGRGCSVMPELPCASMGRSGSTTTCTAYLLVTIRSATATKLATILRVAGPGLLRSRRGHR